MGTLKLQSNEPLYSKMVTGTLAVDGWAVTFGTARRGLGGLCPHQGPPRCTKCNSPPINGQCTNFTSYMPLHTRGLMCTYHLRVEVRPAYQLTDVEKTARRRLVKQMHLNAINGFLKIFFEAVAIKLPANYRQRRSTYH